MVMGERYRVLRRTGPLCRARKNFEGAFASGLNRQDNDLIVSENAEAAAAFKHNFDARFASGETLAPSTGR
jgi:hypothetical protein